MKKILTFLLVIFCFLSLTSCDDLEEGNLDLGNIIDNITLSLKNGNKVEINSSTDPIEIYNVIAGNYIKGTAYKLTSKINQLNDIVYNQEINGTYYYNSSNNLNYVEINNTELDLQVYYYNIGSSEMLYLVKHQNAPLYGGARMNETNLYFKNGDQIVDTMFPPMSEVTDKKTETNCIYLTNVDGMKGIISNGIFRGFYFEVYRYEFTYSVSLTDKYIILTVEQPFGELIPSPLGKDPDLMRKGEVVKKVHFNINTFEIDYVEANVKTYCYNGYYGMLYDYCYILSKIDSSPVNESIKKLKEYINANTVTK